MRDKDREQLEKMLVVGKCWQGSVLYGKANPHSATRSFTWDIRQFRIPKPGGQPLRPMLELDKIFPTDYADTSFFFASIPHNSSWSQTWLDFALAMGYLPETEDVIILPPGCGESLDPDKLEDDGVKIVYMERGREVLRDASGGDISFASRLSTGNIPEYRLVFSGQLPLNIRKLLERNARRIIASKLKYAFRSSFSSGGFQRDPEADTWDVFQHARCLSLGHLEIDAADDLAPESEWERAMLDLLSDTDLSSVEAGRIEDGLSAIVEELETYESFWLSALSDSPVAPIQYRFQDSNQEEVERWADILGVKPLIDSYIAGVAAEDVVGGKIEHRGSDVEVRI